MAKKQKEMTKAKKITNIVIMVIQLIIIIACIAFSIVMVVSSQGNQKGELRNGINLMPVLSNSMEGDKKDSFTTNDLVFVKKFKNEEEKKAQIKEGDIVCFEHYLKDLFITAYVTHRVVHIVTDEERAAYKAEHGIDLWYDVVTQGDYNKELNTDEKELLTYNKIEGYYTGQIKGLGGVITFLKKPQAFFPLIVVPLVLLLLYNAYVIIKATLDAKLIKLNEEKDEQTQQAIAAALAAAGLSADTATKPVNEIKAEDDVAIEENSNTTALENKEVKPVEIDEEAIKRKAIEEYLAKQAIEEYKAKQAKEQEDKEKEDK